MIRVGAALAERLRLVAHCLVDEFAVFVLVVVGGRDLALLLEVLPSDAESLDDVVALAAGMAGEDDLVFLAPLDLQRLPLVVVRRALRLVDIPALVADAVKLAEESAQGWRCLVLGLLDDW